MVNKMIRKFILGVAVFSILFFASCGATGPEESDESSVEQVDTIRQDVNLEFNQENASSFAQLALNCIQHEYPNKLGQVLGDNSYLKEPSELHPAFYGCFDWHSAVHGHWMLIKLLKDYPTMPEAKEIRQKLSENLTKENIAIEVSYFDDRHNKNYERTYGWAWLLQLANELLSWDDPDGKIWYDNLQPLTDLITNKYLEFLPKLNYPIRVGEHPNTAFGLSFAYDYASDAGLESLKSLIISRAKDFYSDDQNCPISWEPGGFDFLSPCLEEANLMRRVLSKEEFKTWVNRFMPSLTGSFKLEPATVSDRSDGKLVHLDGVNLSRAWCLYGISKVLENNDLRLVADHHLKFTLPNIASGEYSGEHWLGSFSVYALSQR
jgi:hypothetical protein